MRVFGYINMAYETKNASFQKFDCDKVLKNDKGLC